MGYIVRMPKLGVEMEQGVVLEWHVSEGDRVEEGEVVAEIESEKTQAEVAARESGVLQRILLDVEEEGEPGAAMGIVAGPDESIDDLLEEVDAEPGAESGTDSGPEAGESTPDPAGSAPEGEREPAAGGRSDGAAPAATGGTAGGETKATPKAKALARELGVDPARVEGTGPRGSVTAADVERAAGSSGGPRSGGSDGAGPGGRAGGTGAAAGTPGGGAATAVEGRSVTADDIPSAEGVKASPRARRRAAELGVDLSTVEGTGPEGSVVEADVEGASSAGTAAGATGAEPPVTGRESPGDGTPAPTATRTVRERREQSRMRKTIARRLGQSWREAPHVTVDRRIDAEPLFAAVEAAEASGYDVSMTDVLLRAVSETLADHPAFNATFEDGVHTIYEEQNVGIAVDVEDGLITPVLPDVGNRTVDEIAAVRAERTDRALSGEFTADDLSGGTFTVSNLGVFGVDSFTPIINPPEVAILGVNDVEERPVKGERGGFEFRRHLGFSLSFDHRVVDGADAARFLDTLADHLENAVALVP